MRFVLGKQSWMQRGACVCGGRVWRRTGCWLGHDHWELEKKLEKCLRKSILCPSASLTTIFCDSNLNLHTIHHETSTLFGTALH